MRLIASFIRMRLFASVCSIIEFPEKETMPNLVPVGDASTKARAVVLAASKREGEMSFASMLLEESMAITKENVLEGRVRCIVSPERENTIRAEIKQVRIKTRRFFERRSMPLILAMASKFANFRALARFFFRMKK